MKLYSVAEVIEPALQLVKVLSYGEPVGGPEGQTALNVLNFLLAEWSMSFKSYRIYDKTCNMPGQSSDTYILLGTNDLDPDNIVVGDIAERPLSVDKLYWTNNGITYPMPVRAYNEYNDISMKNLSNFPSYAYVRDDFPIMTIFLNAILTTGTLRVTGKQLLQQPETVSDILEFDPVYINAIVSNLALKLWPYFNDGEATQSLVIAASSSLKHIKTNNFKNNMSRPVNPMNPIGTSRYTRFTGRGW